jgi:CRP-like cAMP-binding protein
MVKRNPLEPRWQAILDVALVPAVARLPAAVPVERRDTTARHALLCRIHSEFEEMRGLSLTRAQAAKMFGLPPEIASRILERLIDARVLRERSDGRFALRVEEV